MPEASPELRQRFRALQARLVDIWRAIEAGSTVAQTSVVVPSLSFDRQELAKIAGAPFYEERLLFSLIRLRDPHARCIYVTSQPVHPAIVDYYLQLLIGVPARHARSRLKMFCTYDARSVPLTAKILARPRLVERIRRAMGDPAHAYLTCFNSTKLERQLAVELGIPLNGVDPDLLALGTKSGSRAVFREAGVALAPGREGVHSEGEVIDALVALAQEDPELRRAVIKLNESFAGAGNALFHFPQPLPAGAEARRAAIAAALPTLEWSSEECYDAFLGKLAGMGGIVEAFLEAEESRSPSVQMRIVPTGDIELVSTHDQVLGGTTGQTYIGCRFPCDPAYRQQVQDAGWRIAQALARHGVVSRFGVDFMVLRDEGTHWRLQAIEINLRMGGTTPPFLALQFLTGGELDPGTGELRTLSGRVRCYRATDSLVSSAYRGLLPEDFVDILADEGLQYRPVSETGVLFHMIGALSEHGKVGVTCIGRTQDEADALFARTAEVLDAATSQVSVASPSPPSSRDRPLPRME